MIKPMKEVVLELLSTNETMSRINRAVQMVLLMVLNITKVLGFSLCRARRTISVMVKTRHITSMAIHIGTTLLGLLAEIGGKTG